MRLVRIELLLGHPHEERAAIGDAVHQAMTETIEVPSDDIFQVIAEHDATGLRYDPGYLGIRRDDGVVFVHITLRGGRTDGRKRALYTRIAELLSARAGVESRNLLVVLSENELIDW